MKVRDYVTMSDNGCGDRFYYYKGKDITHLIKDLEKSIDEEELSIAFKPEEKTVKKEEAVKIARALKKKLLKADYGNVEFLNPAEIVQQFVSAVMSRMNKVGLNKDSGYNWKYAIDETAKSFNITVTGIWEGTEDE